MTTYLEEINWQAAESAILAVDPQLAKIIRDIPKAHSFKLLSVKYPFGTKVLHNTKMYLPNEYGVVHPLEEKYFPRDLINKLNYRFTPVWLILKGSMEVFSESAEQIMPTRFCRKGALLGLWQLFDPEPSMLVKKIWNLSSGARSIFMLPRISDAISHSRLKRDYGINTYPPKNLLAHKDLFRDLMKSSVTTKQNWNCEVIYFPREWIDAVENDPDFLTLKNYWLSVSWKQAASARNYLSFDMAREYFNRTISKRNLSPKAYILNTIRHLMAIGEGIFPGFVPAANHEDAGPIHAIQDAYINSYLLKKQAPIIMHPFHLNEEDEYKTVYYSLSLPTLYELAPQTKKLPSIMADIREIKMLMGIMDYYFKDSAVEYKFFHNEADRFDEILDSKTMPDYDENLTIYPKEYGEREFPYTSSFFRGCVMIRKKT